MDNEFNEISGNTDETEEKAIVPDNNSSEKVEGRIENTEPKIYDAYDDMIKRLKDDVKNLKKIKKQQKKILKLEEKRKEVLNDIERKREIEMKLKERERKKHRKH